jgi:hypothetical protein
MPKNITVTFDDGSSHVYQNAPDTVTPEEVAQRASQEFGKRVVNMDGGQQPEPPPPLSLLRPLWAVCRVVCVLLLKVENKRWLK